MAQWKHEIGFIGMGNMGYAILKGLLKEYGPEQLIFSEPGEGRRESVAKETGVAAAPDNAACASSCHYLILAVKPQMFDAVIPGIRDVVTEEQVIIYLAPGITRESVRERFGKPCRVVRTMPNTPALVGEGMTGVCYDQKEISGEEQETLHRLFTSFGKMVLVEEHLMDAVGCASGCSPAYVYLFIEALADSAVKYGLPRAMAYELVAQTVLGSAKMVLETSEHPGRLKDMVCSPGGTTIEGVSALEEYGMRNALIKATDASYAKSMKLK